MHGGLFGALPRADAEMWSASNFSRRLATGIHPQGYVPAHGVDSRSLLG